MATEFIKFDNTNLHVVKKIKNLHERADIERILLLNIVTNIDYNEVTKTIDFQHITKDSLNDSVNQLLQSNKLINTIDRRKDSFFLTKIPLICQLEI